MTRAPLVILIGSSGVGKTTLISRSAAHRWPRRWGARVLRKDVTRGSRGAGEALECRSLAPAEFRHRESAEARYAVSYRSFGESYGLPWTELHVVGERTLAVTALPPGPARELAGKVTDRFDPRVCLVEVPVALLRSRLLERDPLQPVDRFEARLASAAMERRSYADHVLDGDGSPDEVFDTFRRWVETQFALI